jgi:predicted amidohydrolase YtcJ
MPMSVDLLILNGAVLTQDPAKPRVEAVAVKDGRIVKLGRSKDLTALKGRKTKVIDAGGTTVLPGFIEAHMHILPGSLELSMLDVSGLNGLDAIRNKVQAYAKTHPGNELIVGMHLSYIAFGNGRSATRHDLDQCLPDRPLVIYASDHHTAWANTKALELGGIMKGRALPPGHEIVMGQDGLATGELREPYAIGPAVEASKDYERTRMALEGKEVDPFPDDEEFEKDLNTVKQGMAHLARNGITSFQNMDGNIYTMQVLHALEKRGELTARAKVPFHYKPFMGMAALERARLMTLGYSSALLNSRMVKIFMDGVLDSGTAVVLDDYPDKPGWRGDPLLPQEHFNRVAIAVDKMGYQIAVHAIGDGAVRMVLNGYEAARKANGKRDSRHRIEHIEIYHPDDMKRFKSLGVLASMQTCHAPGMSGLPLEPTLSKIGEAKWPYAYAWQNFRKAKVPLVFGTDWPVSDVNPLKAIHSAVTRRTYGSESSQRQTLADTLHSYTAMGAYAEFTEKEKGALKKGYLGDIVVLDRDVTKVDPAELEVTKPVATVMGGKTVFQA